jgi:hypothetical protein
LKEDLDLNPEEAMRLASEAGLEFDAANQDLRNITPQVWFAIAAANDPPELFLYGDRLVRFETKSDGRHLLNPLTTDRLIHSLVRVATWYRSGQSGQKRIVVPPLPVVRDVLATPAPPIPVLLSITHCPT